MRGWSYNVLYVYRRTTNDNDDEVQQSNNTGVSRTRLSDKWLLTCLN